MTTWDDEFARVWHRSRSLWHWPQLPSPRLGEGTKGQFPFHNYQIEVVEELLSDSLLLEDLFDHLIVHYVFCPRSLETAGQLALAALNGMKRPTAERARIMVNIFSDIVADSFRLERSPEDEQKVILGWSQMEPASPLDRAVMAFLGRYWGAELGFSDLPEVDLLSQVFSPGVRDRSLWPRQCQQMSRILERLETGRLGAGPIPTQELLRGNARSCPLASLASSLEPERYQLCLEVLGLSGDLIRWYRDQGYSIRIRATRYRRSSEYPSGPSRWRLCDPPEELDIHYSLSLSPRLIPGITTYKRDREVGALVPGRSRVSDLLLIIDSSRSMEGHSLGSRSHNATLAAFKAAQFAHDQGAKLAAINFSDRFVVQSWTRDLLSVEEVLVQYLGGRTQVPGGVVLELACKSPGCLIICITDTQIQNLYMEWENLLQAASIGRFVLFCIDEEFRDKYVESALASLGTVYYINRPSDLISLVVDTTEKAYGSGEPSKSDSLT